MFDVWLMKLYQCVSKVTLRHAGAVPLNALFSRDPPLLVLSARCSLTFKNDPCLFFSFLWLTCVLHKIWWFLRQVTFMENW